ncbi:MAG: murein biosynthesis integral membrane protein MurJ [Deltaproteobacteria bacterium]|nr:murein biosynthesis integral membrane protein MurJ [Deltaproteobacteria bacterium]
MKGRLVGSAPAVPDNDAEGVVTPAMVHSIRKKVGIAAVIMMASVLLSRLIGLAREMVIAYTGGASSAVDAYQLAFFIPEILNHIVASGFLSITFIPIFSHYLAKNDEAEGWRVFSLVLTVVGGFLLVFILVAGVFAPQLIDIVALGRPDPVFKSQVVRMTRIILPAQFFFFTGGLLMAVQFAKEKFAIPALAPIFYNFGIIFCGVVLGPRVGMEGFSWGVMAGAFFGNFALQWWGARRVGLNFRLCFNLRHPDLKRYVILTLPLMVGLTMMFSMEIFIRFFGAYLDPGGIAGLNYSRTILLIPVGLFGQAVGVASYPFMARLVAEHKLQEMNALMNGALRYLALVIPFSILLMVLRHEIVYLLFERGRFDARATALTAHILLYLLPGAFALSAYTVVVRAYYAIQNTWFPAVFGTIAVLFSLPVYWYGLNLIGAGGIALAVSLSSVFQLVALYALWNKRGRNRGSRAVYRFYAYMLLFSGLLGIGLEYFKDLLQNRFDGASLTGSLLTLLIVGAVFSVALAGIGRLLHIKEIDDLSKRIRQKLRRSPSV